MSSRASLPLLSIVALSIALPTFASGPAKASAQETPMTVARQMATEYKTALMKKDVGYFDKRSTSDFVYIDEKGRKMLRGQSMEQMKQGFAMMTIDSMTENVVSAKKAEGGVLFTTDMKMAATLKMPSAKDKKKMAHLDSTARFDSLVVKQDGVWKYKRVKMIKSKDLVDGKTSPM